MVGDRERVAHVVRRLSMGVHPDRLDGLADTDAAIAAALDLSAAPAPPLEMAVPTDYRNPQPGEIAGAISWWTARMATSARLVEERLVWFWHDHFATSIVKVRVPYLMYQQHLTIRQHATANFADLLRAVSRDPAMLFYLDGISNQARQVNENFGRECMELFTLGIGGGYTQDDVVDASRAFSGWIVNVPGRRFTRDDIPPWTAYFVPQRHDAGEKTLLGTTAALDMDGALDVILDQPATGRFVAAKLYRELVGVEPDDKTAARLGDAFASDYAILPLVEAIVAEAAFTDDAGVRTKARTPVEKLVGLVQAVPGGTTAGQTGNGGRRNQQQSPLGQAFRTMGYIPFVPPNVGGFPSGESLLGPHQLVHTFDLLSAIPAAPGPELTNDVDALFARFGLFDVSDRSRDVVAGERDPGRRVALVFTSPEYAAT